MRRAREDCARQDGWDICSNRELEISHLSCTSFSCRRFSVNLLADCLDPTTQSQMFDLRSTTSFPLLRESLQLVDGMKLRERHQQQRQRSRVLDMALEDQNNSVKVSPFDTQLLSDSESLEERWLYEAHID